MTWNGQRSYTIPSEPKSLKNIYILSLRVFSNFSLGCSGKVRVPSDTVDGSEIGLTSCMRFINWFCGPPIPMASLNPTNLHSVRSLPLQRRCPPSDIHGIHGLLLGLFVKGTTKEDYGKMTTMHQNTWCVSFVYIYIHIYICIKTEYMYMMCSNTQQRYLTFHPNRWLIKLIVYI